MIILNLLRKMHMVDIKNDLSARYYVAECTAAVLGAILLVERFTGLASSQSLPVLKIMLADKKNYLRIAAILLIFAMMYLIFEWLQSSWQARLSYWAKARAGSVLLFACTSLWICYPLITAGTTFVSVSPAWYLCFLVIGILLGQYVSNLAFIILMVRTSTEANILRLPRIPVVTRPKIRYWIEIVLLLLTAFLGLWYFSPDVIKAIGVICVCFSFIFMIVKEFAWMFLSQDKDGKRISRLAILKNIHNMLDYDHLLSKRSSKIVNKIEITSKDSPQSIQKKIREKTFVDSSAEFRFCVKQEEAMQFELYFKDGNKYNQSPNNRGIRISKRHGNKDLLRVLVIPAEPEEKSIGMELSINIIEKNAEQYISTHVNDEDLTLRKVLSYAINQTVIQALAKKAEPLLQIAVEAGQEDRVKELLKQNIDVDERGEGGWTAILYASAQGYPRILRLLLDAGANPDIGNLLKINPLLYGARYGNLEVCQILLEYGANTDLQDIDGRTALMIAASLGHIDVVNDLLKAGANVTIKDRYSMTALDIAQSCKQGEIAKLIRKAKKSVRTSK